MRNIAAAIEFGTSKIICVIGREKSIGRFEVLGSGVAGYEGIKNGRWLRRSNLEDAVSKALLIAERRAKKHVKEAYIGVPGVFSKVVCKEGFANVQNGRVTDTDIDKFLGAAADYYKDPRYRIVGGSPVYFLLDDGERYIDVLGSETEELRGKVSFMFAKKQFIEDVTEVLKNAGVKIKAFIPEIVAESLFLVPTEERDSSAVLLNIGYYDTNVSVVYGDAVVYNRTIHSGGMHLANDLSLVMNMEVEVAEQIKKRYSFGLENSGTKIYDYARPKSGRMEKYNHSLVSEIIEARVEHLCRLVYEAFEQSPIPIARRTRIFLTGGGLAMMKGARDILENQLKRQVRLARVVAPSLSTPNYYAALALLDFVFEREYFGEAYGGESLLKRISEKMYD